MTVFLYIIVVFFGLAIPIIIGIYGLFCIFVDFKGAPYVPTSSALVYEILAEAKLKPNQFFIELGSGDGRVTRTAVKLYKVKGLGVDLHIPLILYSRFLVNLQGLRDTDFRIQNFFATNLIKADVVFMFLLPATVEKLKTKLEKECKGKLVISHGFQIKGFEKYLVKKQERKLFPTYFYRI